jgi:hypothetical protein
MSLFSAPAQWMKSRITRRNMLQMNEDEMMMMMMMIMLSGRRMDY